MDDGRREEQTRVAERRSTDRQVFEGGVIVEFEGLQMEGPARNVSASGVYFVAEGQARVRVRIDGETSPRDAELVRVESLGAGRFGIAVRFVD